ncbi:MBOAT family protein [Symmachiella macrocystis]|uniref:MBOAT family protein n=1 Tax=Symmachiella macrocystis TaxID=2527985 RepID=A0A5C6BHS5_9PLAN|nr:acyl-CoA acyltransferase [Symmachiella macrocystis]TWU11272.1 MBOAT family protein [Symmachiella macrocystis]
MHELFAFLFSVTTAYGYALAAWPVLRLRGRVVVSTITGLAVFVCPLLIPAEHVILRAAVTFLCAELMLKMLDVARQFRRRGRGAVGFPAYARFLIPFPVLFVIFGRRENRTPFRGSWRLMGLKVLSAAVVILLGFALVDFFAQFSIVRTYFLVDHLLKLAIFVLTIEGISRLVNGLERLAGFDIRPVIDRAYVAQTVAEFWCRYNNRVHAWFEHNLFGPVVRHGSPAWGITLCFFASGVFHELGFGIATSRFDGYQFLFFMLQVPAVLISRPLHRWGTRGGIANKLAAHGFTVAWMSATSIFFFHSVNRVFPFYYASEPWLP